MTCKIFLVVWETFIVNSTSWVHVLPSSFIQQVPSCAAPRAWILLIDSTIFLSESELDSQTADFGIHGIGHLFWKKMDLGKEFRLIILQVMVKESQAKRSHELSFLVILSFSFIGN